MTPKQRLKQFADEVKAAGLAGHSMQKKMSEIVERHDLTPHEIQRIAEMANRDVQLELYKTSNDKRFKFELIDPVPLRKMAKKNASVITAVSDQAKIATAMDQSGGDPFRVPYRVTPHLSLFEHPLSEKIAFDLENYNSRELLQKLDRTRLEYEAMKKQGEAEMCKVAAKSQKDYDRLVQNGLDLLMHGVTFTSLYQAIFASAGGGSATEAQRKSVDDLALLLLDGLKRRGVQNHRLGFRHRGNVAALDKLSSEELLALAKRALGQVVPQDLVMEPTKKADYVEASVSNSDNTRIPLLMDEAGKYLNERSSVKDYPCPQPYLDDFNTDNLVNGEPKAFNGESTFVVSVSDLMGDQSRMVRMHSANEYIGLKLQQIEEAMRKLMSAQKMAEAEMEKKAAIGPVKPGFMKTLGSQVVNDPLKGLEAGGGLLSGSGLLATAISGPIQQYMANSQADKARAEERSERRRLEHLLMNQSPAQAAQPAQSAEPTQPLNAASLPKTQGGILT